MKGFFICLLITISSSLYAARVDSVTIFSNAMHRSYKAVVIVPDAASVTKGKLFPSVYLLHGYSGYFSNWIQRVPQLTTFADTYQLIIICPEGGFSSWYFDSPVDTTMRFETYITKEVPDYIDEHYPTFKNRNARAITGLSMGGHGGLFLGFRHADFFGACGSMSGALVIDVITKGYGVEKVLGDTVKNRHYYRELSVMNEMEHYKSGKDSLAIIMDCGTEDFIIEMSRAAHQKMLSLKIPHDYTERPGKHSWEYWANAVQYQLLYFRNYFDRVKKA